MSTPCTRVTTRKRWAQAKYTKKFLLTGGFVERSGFFVSWAYYLVRTCFVNGIILKKDQGD